MHRFWKNLFVLPVLAAALLAGCDAGERSSLEVPTAPRPILGGLLGGTTSSYTLVRDPLVTGLTGSVSTSTLVGIDGGQVTLLGHTLAVPSGAVLKPTLFTLTVLPTGYVEVDLTATLSSVLGLVLNVGESGFVKPVRVTLTYSRATNVEDPRKLVIVHLKGLLGYKQIEPLPSRVDLVNRTVTADLDHFSRYSLAMP